eukprot:TRINITY_DN2824_c0_g5_i1.p1 TRINITY_DN2824_c0_g5~~TRINITY_DN2824_c0_g5_i1.p1  ORF type:complete len:201 (+),score=43.92 TRINITY_DN2824_c0_g5_i1:200-802(+)
MAHRLAVLLGVAFLHGGRAQTTVAGAAQTVSVPPTVQGVVNAAGTIPAVQVPAPAPAAQAPAGEPGTLPMPQNTAGKDKVVLLIMEILPLYICGIDRCYMGSYCTGILKGMSLGGLGIWVIIDWLTIIPNAIEKQSSIDSMGIEGTFTTESVQGAHLLGYIAIIGIVLKIAATAINAPSVTNVVVGRKGQDSHDDEMPLQ